MTLAVSTYFEGHDDTISLNIMDHEEVVSMFNQIFEDYEIDAPYLNTIRDLINFVENDFENTGYRLAELFRFTIVDINNRQTILEW